VFAEWKKVRVHIDYHVEVDGHYYSVPHTLVKRQLDVRYTATTVECFHQGQRVASHVRSALKGRHTTLAVSFLQPCVSSRFARDRVHTGNGCL
jgi:transposase